jgi:hypothetical protein
VEVSSTPNIKQQGDDKVTEPKIQAVTWKSLQEEKDGGSRLEVFIPMKKITDATL